MNHKFVNIFFADEFAQFGEGINGPKALIDGKWVMARPLGFIGLFWRLARAWEVFTGKADVLRWYKQ